MKEPTQPEEQPKPARTFMREGSMDGLHREFRAFAPLRRTTDPDAPKDEQPAVRLDTPA